MWQISKINTLTNQVTLRHTRGDEVDLVIPPEHTHSSAAKNAYIKSEMDSRVFNTPGIVQNKLVIIETTIILALILLKVLHYV